MDHHQMKRVKSIAGLCSSRGWKPFTVAFTTAYVLTYYIVTTTTSRNSELLRHREIFIRQTWEQH